MFFHTDNEVAELVRRFEAQTLPRSEWTHKTHLVVGLYYCFSYPFGVAKNLMRDGIYWLNDKHGTPNTETSGYHATLTNFWLERIREVVDSVGRAAGLAALANEVTGRLNDKDLPLRYFTRELLFSRKARVEVVEPDKNSGEVMTTQAEFCYQP